MSRGFPSMTALLGLLAVAGYQNRDKIAEMLGGRGQSTPERPGQSGIGGFLGQLGKSLGGVTGGGILSGGLGELVDRFTQSGQGQTAGDAGVSLPRVEAHQADEQRQAVAEEGQHRQRDDHERHAGLEVDGHQDHRLDIAPEMCGANRFDSFWD